MRDLLPFIVFAMILYDFSAHFVALTGLDKFLIKHKLNWWPEHIYGKKYQIFWTAFWGTAFLLLGIYIIL